MGIALSRYIKYHSILYRTYTSEIIGELFVIQPPRPWRGVHDSLLPVLQTASFGSTHARLAAAAGGGRIMKQIAVGAASA